MVDATLLSIIGNGGNALNTLIIGGFTNQPANTPLAASAAGVTLDGPINLTIQAFTLNLLANGPISEPGGPLKVTNVIGSSTGIFSLTNPGNAIAESLGITATNGDVVVVDNSNLQLFGTQSGNNLFFEVAASGGTLALRDLRPFFPAPVLTAATNGRISLVADNYAVAADSSIIAPAGTLELAPFSSNVNVDTSRLLNPPGPLSASIINAGTTELNTLVIGGFTDLPHGGTASISAASITIDAALDLTNIATTLALEAAVTATTTGSVTQTAPIINVGTLIGTAGNTDLSTNANTVGSIGRFTVTGAGNSFKFANAANASLGVLGPLSATQDVVLSTSGTAAISATGNIGAGRTLSAVSGSGGISIATGAVLTAPTIDLNGSSGGITLSDNASVGQAGGVVDLTATGVGVSEAGTSTIIAGILQSSGNVAGPVTLTNGNAVASIGGFMVTGAGNSFTLVDAADVSLGVAGPLSAAEDVALSTSGSGAITATGSIGAGRTLSVASGSGGISLGNGAALTGPTINLNGAAGGIALSGNASVGQTGGLVDLTTTGGGVTEAATARVTAETLQSSGGITGNVALTGVGNAIAALGSLSVSGGTFSLTDTGNLNVAGKLTASDITIGDAGVLTVSNSLIAAGTANLTATSIDIPGLVSGGSVALSGTAGSINETGSLAAGALSGSTIGAANLTGVNQVRALGNFSADSFTLNDSTDLLLEGTLNAARIAILDPSSRISLGDGATIVTGGTSRPPGPIQPPLEPVDGAPGALLESASFTQIGSSTVSGQGGGPATLQISTTGRDQFDPPLGLQATGTWLILDLANGTAAGDVFVNALDVTYTAPGGTDLFGTIGGVVGGRAASLGFIRPAINTNYLFNGCVIAAAVCTTTSLNTGLTATLGAIYPLISITPPALTNLPDLVLVALPMLQPQPPQLTDPDVVPPNITYQDY